MFIECISAKAKDPRGIQVQAGLELQPVSGQTHVYSSVHEKEPAGFIESFACKRTSGKDSPSTSSLLIFAKQSAKLCLKF